MAGLIAADGDDGRGIQGCTPFAAISALAYRSSITSDAPKERSTGPVQVDDVVRELLAAILLDPPPRAINIGLGYNLAGLRQSTSDPEFRERLRQEGQRLDEVVKLARSAVSSSCRRRATTPRIASCPRHGPAR